jgi:type IV secretion system protein VirD4
MMDNRYALLFIRGERPVQDDKFDILRHPNVALTTDGKAKPYQHGEDTRSIADITFDATLLDKAVEYDLGDIADRYELLSEEELEEQFTKQEEI